MKTNSRRRIQLLGSIIGAAALLFAAPSPAQTIYKHIADDGRATFSDRPARASARAPSSRQVTRRVDASEAGRSLKQAQLERSHGAEPQPGELTRSPGADAVNYRYWQRQQKLRLAVEQAQRRSNETQLLLLARE